MEFNCSHCLAWEIEKFIYIFIHQTAEYNRESKTEHRHKWNEMFRKQQNLVWLPLPLSFVPGLSYV